MPTLANTADEAEDAGVSRPVATAREAAAPRTSLADLPVDVLHEVMKFSSPTTAATLGATSRQNMKLFQEYLGRSLKINALGDAGVPQAVGRVSLMEANFRRELDAVLPERQMNALIHKSCQPYKYLLVDARCALRGASENALGNKAQSLSHFMVNPEDSQLTKAAKQCIYGGMALIENRHYRGTRHASDEEAAGGGSGGSPDMMTGAADEESDAAGPNRETIKAAIRKQFDEKSELKKFVAWKMGLDSTASKAHNVFISQSLLQAMGESEQAELEKYFESNPTHTLILDVEGRLLRGVKARNMLKDAPLPAALRHVTLTNTERDVRSIGFVSILDKFIPNVQLKGFEMVENIYCGPSYSKYLKSLSFGFLPNLKYIQGLSHDRLLETLDLRSLYAARIIRGFHQLKALKNILFPYESAAQKVIAFDALRLLTAADLRGFRHLDNVNAMFNSCPQLRDVQWMPGFRTLRLDSGSFREAPALESLTAC